MDALAEYIVETIGTYEARRSEGTLSDDDAVMLATVQTVFREVMETQCN